MNFQLFFYRKVLNQMSEPGLTCLKEANKRSEGYIMKSYSERLPLIDEAIERSNGELPAGTNNRFGNYYVYQGFIKVIVDTFRATEVDGKITGQVCTVEEFSQRAKELGWVNGYKYGVEYPTNGERPDLPGDVLVETKNKVPKWDRSTKRVRCWNWPCCIAFRIVDERYKPKGQVMSNDWHEKGELPPIKTTHNDCELVGIGYSKPEFEVTAHHYNGATAIVSVKTENGVRLHNAKAVHFRPIPTETDKLVEQIEEILEILNGCESVSNKALAHALVNSGYRKILPLSEDDFIEQAREELTSYVSIYQLARLYQAGCRFLDQSGLHIKVTR